MTVQLNYLNARLDVVTNFDKKNLLRTFDPIITVNSFQAVPADFNAFKLINYWEYQNNVEINIEDDLGFILTSYKFTDLDLTLSEIKLENKIRAHIQEFINYCNKKININRYDISIRMNGFQKLDSSINIYLLSPLACRRP